MDVGRNTDSDKMNTPSPLKQRKLRKGANSCWGCKRRKIKCTFKSTTDSVCENCQRRGTHCVGQQYPEDQSGPQKVKGDRLGQIDDRMVRVEAMLTRLSNQGPKKAADACKSAGLHHEDSPLIGCASGLASPKLDLRLAPNATISDTPAVTCSTFPTILTPESQATSSCPPLKFEHRELSKAMLAAYPSQPDIDIICQASRRISIFFHEVNTKSQERLIRGGANTSFHDTTRPDVNTHPVLLARHTLKFTTLLQQLKLSGIDGLSEGLSAITTRLSTTVAQLITCNDDLVGTIEGLECMLLQGVVESNFGNLRRAWTSYRRALSLAQLMRINRPNHPPIQPIDPGTKTDTRFLWFRIVYMDRFLSLLLGLPQGTHDTSMASDDAFAADTIIGKLERIHCAIASRILKLDEDYSPRSDYATIKKIDAELLQAANNMPTNFWMPPTFFGLENDKEKVFWETLRLMDQLVHYSLLTKLHLPYLLRSNQDRKYEYSKIACINASREILIRFIAFRTFNRIVSCCRPLDFFSLMAALTLLLAHLDSHQRQEADNLLAHQRLSDRAMMKQAIDGMVELHKANDDSFSDECLRLLQRLMLIEEQAATGEGDYRTQSENGDESSEDNDESVIFQMAVPYFGVVKVSREGCLSREEPRATRKVTAGPTGSVHTTNGLVNMGEDSPSVYTADRDRELHAMEQLERRSWVTNENMYAAGIPHGALHGPILENQPESQFSRPDTLEIDLHDDSQPGVMASLEDWAFQGVDMSFFDCLMKSTDQSDFMQTDGSL